MSKQKFKVFEAADAKKMEAELNTWAETLPKSARIRRTQLSGESAYGFWALVNYEISDEEESHG